MSSGKHELVSLGVIPDGNRTFAKKEGISLKQGYLAGIGKAREALEWAREYPALKFVSFYTLSLENLKRSSGELKVLLGLFADYLKHIAVLKLAAFLLNFLIMDCRFEHAQSRNSYLILFL